MQKSDEIIENYVNYAFFLAFSRIFLVILPQIFSN